MLRCLFSVFLSALSLFLFPAIFPQSALAIYIPGVSDLQEIQGKLDEIDEIFKESNANLIDFCERRSGDQMNLETWYSGKCQDEDGKRIDTMSGDGVGFSDIVLLDIEDRFNQIDPDETLFDKIMKIIEFANQIHANAGSESEMRAALLEQKQQLFQSNGNGIYNSLANGIAFLITNPPASTKSYIDYISSNLSRHRIIPQANAQTPGFGFSGLSPFLPIWKAVRNLSYIVFTLAFVLYGFMMMFRVNISAKTAITIQLALPKLILTLLMITFSYAIVGLMIDLMYVTFFAVISLLISQKLIVPDSFAVNWSSGQSGPLLSFLINNFFAIIASPIAITNLIIGGPSIFGFVLGIVGAWLVIGQIIALIITIAVAITYARLIWKLLTAFLSIIISLITAPIILLANVLPGSDTFGSWLRNIFANLSVFPITMILLTFSYMLMVQPLVSLLYSVSPISPNPDFKLIEWLFGVRNLNPGGYTMIVPFISPLTSIAGIGNAPDALLALFGIALLLMASKYVDIVRDALKVPPFKYGTAIGEALKTGVSWNEKWAGAGYPGLPGSLGKRARDFYKRGVTPDNKEKEKPSIHIGGTDTGITAPKM